MPTTCGAGVPQRRSCSRRYSISSALTVYQCRRSSRAWLPHAALPGFLDDLGRASPDAAAHVAAGVARPVLWGSHWVILVLPECVLVQAVAIEPAGAYAPGRVGLHP